MIEKCNRVKARAEIKPCVFQKGWTNMTDHFLGQGLGTNMATLVSCSIFKAYSKERSIMSLFILRSEVTFSTSMQPLGHLLQNVLLDFEPASCDEHLCNQNKHSSLSMHGHARSTGLTNDFGTFDPSTLCNLCVGSAFY